MQKRNAGMTVQPSAIMVCNGIDAILFSGTVQRIKRYAWFSAEKCNKFRGMNDLEAQKQLKTVHTS